MLLIARNNIFRHLLVTLVSLSSCTTQPSANLKVESGTNLVGLASPIYLEPDGKKVIVEDYFILPELIDSVVYTGGEVSLSDDHSLLKIMAPVTEVISTLKIYSGDTIYTIPVYKSAKQKTTFNFSDPDKKYSRVQIKGEINQWNPKLGEMNYKDGTWTTSFNLAPGQYQYLFMLDGKETLDPANTDSIDNNIGGYNSLITIKSAGDATPELNTIAYTGNTIDIGLKNVSSLVVLWQNQQIDPRQITIEGEKASIQLPAAASKVKRSFLRIYGTNQ
jgi:cyclomaltodextrinase / maltogenic alpha-amylase / neopullulanase